MIYRDTSIIAAASTGATHSDIARSWLLAQERRALAVSDWTATEFPTPSPANIVAATSTTIVAPSRKMHGTR